MNGSNELLLEQVIELVSKSASLLEKVQKMSTSKNPGPNKTGNDLGIATTELSDLLQQIRDDIGTPAPEVKPTQESSIATQEDDRAGVCIYCKGPIPSARLKVLPDTTICFTCADQQDAQKSNPISVVSDTEAQRYKEQHQKKVEEERLRAKSRRPHRAADQTRKKRRLKRRRKKQKQIT